MVIRFVCAAAALLLGSLAIAPATAATPEKPNIIFIMADDLGWRDLHCQGSGYYQTPNIDYLASQGLRFMSYYECHNCAPTRAALMSGQYAPRTGIYTVGNMEKGDPPTPRLLKCPKNNQDLPLKITTVAQVLKKAGYATAMYGKWHLGNKGDFHPSKRGFDEAIVSAGAHFDFKTDPPVPVPPGIYLADFLTDLSIDFIRRKKDEPFFLYLPHFAVHKPLNAKPVMIEQFFNSHPDGGQGNRIYAAMIASVDQSVGRILATLDELGLAENTIVVFTSDNGGVGGYTPNVPANLRRWDVTDNSPLRSGKGTLYEGGLRVPFIVRWPGKIPAGATTDEPAIHVDILPTLAEFAGASLPNQVVDGVSLVPVMKDPSKHLSRDAIYWHFPGYLQSAGRNTHPQGAIRSGDYKLMEFFEDGHLELYDLRRDIGEKHNLAKEMPDKASELLGKMREWRRSTHAAMPTPIKKSDGAGNGS